MSIYRQLRRGPVTARVSNPYGMYSEERRCDTIYGRLRARRRRQEEGGPRCYHDNRRRRCRPHERDLEFEKERMKEENREKIEKLEKELKEEVEKRRVEAELLEKLKKEVLLVESVEQHVAENTEDHRTDLYDCTEDDEDPQLVVRRGQEFKLTITFQRPYVPEQDDMQLIFKLGEEPNTRKGTYAAIKLREDDNTKYMDRKKKKWGARILENSGNSLKIGVYAPPNTIIGEWEYTIRTIKGKKTEEYEFEGTNDVIILLNPWCDDDQVFYSGDTDDLKEYINNQVGTVFNGRSRRIRSRSWNYGQFQQGILEISLHLLRKAFDYQISKQMGNPVNIARALSRILNDADDNGVLSGRWDGEYDDGVKPTTWTGSATILKKYWKNKCPVKYGQCWVFSHLLTTVARALGLPCRSVTNFASAHDTDETMTIDKYVDEDGDEVEYKNGDSVWNFHVWNEVWMQRPDLDKAFKADGKYNGWHAVDATPQELSGGVYQCGPSPLRAIKEGDVEVGYDTKFIFAEVNAECCDWTDGDPPTLVSKNTRRVGKNLSTKVPDGKGYKKYCGRDEGVRLDVTNLYKYDEGSVAERESVERATQEGEFGDALFEDATGIQLDVLDEDETEPLVGEDVKVKVKVSNTSGEERSVRLRVSVRPTCYWGGLRGKEKIAKKHFSEEKIPAGESKTYELPVCADDYIRLCDEALSMRVLAMARIRGFVDPVFTSEDIDVAHPGMEIQGPDCKVCCGEEFEVKLSFENPLKDRSMTQCQLRLEGTVIPVDPDFENDDSVYMKQIGDLQPGEQRTVTVKVKSTERPRKSQERELEAGLVSKELPDFEGCLPVELD
ncbi:annulin [Aplysia californica]|uniref:Annulin n=1 Tax=Aplysia californica TaxID=6500 RepID=A0ABM1A8Q1_APLCA|nr:annulin [Aplysia californica]